MRPRIEDRQQQLRRERPRQLAAAEQRRQLVAGDAGAGGQRDARKERRPRGADIRIRGDHLLLGLADIGAPQQQVRRQAGRQFRPSSRRRHRPRSSGCRGGEVGRQRLADQQHQRVVVERALAQSAAPARPAPLSSSDSAWRRSSSEVAPLSNFSCVSRIDSSRVVERLPGHREQRLVGLQREARLCDRS